MTTELILLMVAILLVSYSFGAWVTEVFTDSGARLGSRVESQLTIGHRLVPAINGPMTWDAPPTQ